MLDRVTINKLLKTVIAALGATVVVLLSLSAWQSWNRLSVASQATAVADSSSYLFTALHNLRFDRAFSHSSLTAEKAAPMSPVLREVRASEMPALKSAVGALERVNLPDDDALVATLAEHVKRLTALHEETAAAMQRPKAERREGIVEDTTKEIDGLIKFIDQVSAQLASTSKFQDPYIDQLIELKQLAWATRNAVGDAALATFKAIEGQPPADGAVENYVANIGKGRGYWGALEDLASSLSLPAKFDQARQKAKHDYFESDYISAGLKVIKDVVAGQPPGITLEQWMTASKPSLGSLVEVAEVALGIGREHAAGEYASALSNLILQVVWLFAAIALFVGAMLLVTRRVTAPLQELSGAMHKLAAGDFDLVLPGLERQDEIGAMAGAVEEFKELALERAKRETDEAVKRQQAEVEVQSRAAAEQRKHAEEQARAAEEQARVVGLLADGLVKMSQGDLTCRLNEGFPESYRQIRDDFNAMTNRLQETIGAIVTATREITNASAELSASTTDLSQRTEEQAASLEQTSASMEEISATVRKNAENAQQANQSANNTREVADRGGQVVAKAVDAMARIEDSSRKISDIIGVIDEIARQTNLLALNAAVEAARAGEAGRGFAVVASEVRSLAQRSSQAAKDIKDLITNSNSQVKDGVDLVNRAGAALHEIVDSIKQVVQIVSDIASASVEQATGLEEVNKALNQMDEATQQNSALVEENAATAKTLEQQAKTMDGRVAAFRVGGAEKEAAVPVQRAAVASGRGVAPPSRSAPIVTPKRAAVAAPKPVPKPALKRATAANGGGAVARMQAAIANAVNGDDDWKEF